MTHFADRLVDAIKLKQTPLMVGLDPRLVCLPAKLTEHLHRSDKSATAAAVEAFSKAVVDVVAPLVAVVKPQAAFYELLGPMGMQALYNVVQHAKRQNLLVVLDGKRGDIGSTAEAYAEGWLGDAADGGWGCDGLTVNPYLGDDSLTPFVQQCTNSGNGIFVLVRTSNPGGSMLQELDTKSGRLYEVVADHVQDLATTHRGQCGYGCVGAVIGATHPEQLMQLRQRMPNTLFLVPGVGAQGATAADVAGAFDSQGLGAVINSSRAIIFAHDRREYQKYSSDWQRAVETATRDAIAEIADSTPAGRLKKVRN